jgi:polyvinyl alcohol dehydrogenase (cytochrome)
MHRKIITIPFALVLVSVVLFAGSSFLSRAFFTYADHSWSQEQGPTTDSASAQIYKERCAVCHDRAKDRIPPRSQIAKQATEDVIRTLTTGTMKDWAYELTADQIRALAVFVTGKQPGASVQGSLNENLCKDPAGPINLNGSQWNGWGRDLDNSRYQPKPEIKPEDVPRLKVKWAWTHPGPMATGQPTIIGDRLFVTTEVGQLYSLNAQTGCAYWTMNAGAGLRPAVIVGPLPAASKAKFALYFGDHKSNVQAVDAATGELLWKTRVEEHRLSRITGSPVLYRDRLYVPVSSIEEVTGTDAKYECCKFRGSLVALDAFTGKILWKSFTVQEEPRPFKKNSFGTQMYGPAGGAIWSAPTLDLKRKVIYVGTGNSYTDVPTGHSDAIVAFDLETGKIKWVNQVTPKDNFLVGCRQPGMGNCPEEAGPDYDFGSSPILRTLPGGKQVILAGQKSGVIYALDPDHDGKILWQVRLGAGGALGGIEWGFAADGQNVYVPVADVFGAARKPGITALKITNGAQLWHVPAPAANCSWGKVRCNNSQSAAATLIPGVVFSGTTDGHLRAYLTRDGTIIWDYDTALPIPTVNGGETKGGALDGGGPIIANGILYTNSGYGRIVGQPGNLLLAFTVDGK